MLGAGRPSAEQLRDTVSLAFTVWLGDMRVMFGGSVNRTMQKRYQLL